LKRVSSYISGNIDWVSIMLYFSLVMIGWVAIYAADYNREHPMIFDLSQNYGKQFLWIAISFFVAICFLIIDSKFYTSFSYIIYGFILLALIVVLFFGKEVAGSRSWFEVGSLKIQPSEFAKYTTTIALAKYISTRNSIIKGLKSKLITLAIIGAPALLIILQGDMGSALAYAAFVLVLYREGLSEELLLFGLLIILLFILALLIDKFILIFCLLLIVVFISFLFRKSKRVIYISIISFVISSSFIYGVNFGFNNFLKPHQQARIKVLLGQDVDLKGAAYNVNQSKIAIGSGGFWGKGFLKGTQTKYDFVPEQSTDFIFCTIGEEYGFFGSLIVIGIFLGLLIRIIFISERQRSKFTRIYGYGVASLLFLHMVINVGMTIGLVPIIGIPFPFISYGGSALLAFTILLFTLLKLDAERLMFLR